MNAKQNSMGSFDLVRARGIAKLRGTTVFAGLVFALGLSVATTSLASKRTISFYSLNTRESLTVTYKRNGRYIPRAMRKLNYILRDWRVNQTTRMDPKVIDLVWELHNQLRSHKPIHLVSAYRSPKTNAMRRRRSRGVAKHSRHIRGQAIDLFFPDVSVKVLRESALIKQRGGVGYYPRSRLPFVHIDTGRVRHWPRMPASAYARLLKRGNRYIRLAAKRRPVPSSRKTASSLRVASTLPPSPIRNKQPARDPKPFPVLNLKNPPVPKRKPILVALNMAPHGESWLTPSGAPGNKTQTRILASAASVSAPSSSTWENVKKRLHKGADTLMAFAGRQKARVQKPQIAHAKTQTKQQTTIRKTLSSPMRLARADAAPGTAEIVSSLRKQVTTATIRRTSTPTKSVIKLGTADPLLMAEIKPQHVWSATSVNVVSLMRTTAQLGSPAFSGTLFGKVETAVFTLEPQLFASAEPTDLRALTTGSTKRNPKVKAKKPSWISRLFSDWGLTRPANAKTRTARNARAAD